MTRSESTRLLGARTSTQRGNYFQTTTAGSWRTCSSQHDGFVHSQCRNELKFHPLHTTNYPLDRFQEIKALNPAPKTRQPSRSLTKLLHELPAKTGTTGKQLTLQQSHCRALQFGRRSNNTCSSLNSIPVVDRLFALSLIRTPSNQAQQTIAVAMKTLIIKGYSSGDTKLGLDQLSLSGPSPAAEKCTMAPPFDRIAGPLWNLTQNGEFVFSTNSSEKPDLEADKTQLKDVHRSILKTSDAKYKPGPCNKHRVMAADNAMTLLGELESSPDFLYTYIRMHLPEEYTPYRPELRLLDFMDLLTLFYDARVLGRARIDSAVVDHVIVESRPNWKFMWSQLMAYAPRVTFYEASDSSNIVDFLKGRIEFAALVTLLQKSRFKRRSEFKQRKLAHIVAMKIRYAKTAMASVKSGPKNKKVRFDDKNKVRFFDKNKF